MRKFYLLCIMLFIASTTMSQPEWELKAGKGFWGDVLQLISPGFGWEAGELQTNPEVRGKMFKGSMTWMELSYKLETGYSVALFLGNGNTSQFYNDYLGFYWESKYYYVYNMYSLTFLRDFKIRRHHLLPGGGVSYRSVRESYIDYDIQYDENENILYSWPNVYNSDFRDLGLEIKFDYQYEFSAHFFLGLRFMGNITLAIGLENVMISPFISLRI